MPVYPTRLDETLPNSLRTLPRWVRWDLVQTNGNRTTKRPQASTRTGPWRTLDEIVAGLPEHTATPLHGPGLVLTGGVAIEGRGTLFALDIDGCRNPETGEIAEWAKDVVRVFRSYTEVTPSKSGLRIFGYVPGAVPKLPVIAVPATPFGDHKRCEIQVFGAGPAGYVTVTGWELKGAPRELRDGTAGFAFISRTWADAIATTPSAAEPAETRLLKPVGRVPTDAEIDRAVRRIASDDDVALIDGKWSAVGLPSASEGWFQLVRLVVSICAGHADAAVSWLLTSTAYGRGEVEESKDPLRYATERWVRADVQRVAAKMHALVESTFTPVPYEGEPLAASQRSPFEREIDLSPAVALNDNPPVSAAALFTPVAETPVVPAKGEKPAYFEDVFALVQRDPRPKWLIKGLLERDCLTVLVGAPASFKSFLAFDLALTVSLGREWHGRKVHQAPALIVVGEGRGGLSRRFRAWSEDNEVDLGDAKIAVTRHAAQMLDDDGFKFLVVEAKRKAVEWGQNPGLVVIDTLNRNFGPGDENSTADMTKFWERCDILRHVFPGCNVIVVHHVGHNAQTRARGSSTIGATVDAEIVLTRARDPKTDAPQGAARVVCRKMKDGDEPPPFWITTKFVNLGTDEEGDTYGSLVIDKVSDAEPHGSGNDVADPQVQADMDAVLRAYRTDHALSTAAAREVTGLPERRFRNARLLAVEYDLLTKSGSTSNCRYALTTTGLSRLDAPAELTTDIGTAETTENEA